MAEQVNMRYQTYGREANMLQVKSFLKREMQMNRENFAAKRRRRAVCVWGMPGIGKTDIVKSFQDEGYRVLSVPLAQFEEMGDLNGIPQERQDPKSGEWFTYSCPPEWAPNIKLHGEKVVLLFDDFNRADPRIVKGTMQLIQDYGLVTWGLDQADYHIVCTANPEGGLNDVTPLDPAQISRFSHITLKVEGEDGVRNWAVWASENGVDNRAISFMLMHPEWLFTGKDRINPRTWTQAFDILRSIPDSGSGQPLTKENAELLQMHTEACVEKEAADAFTVFMTKGIMEMIEPEQILENLEKVMPKLRGLSGLEGSRKTARVDCLFAIFERLYLYLRSDGYQPNEKDKQFAAHGVNFCRVMASELSGTDMRWAIVRRLFHENEKTRTKVKTLINLAKVADKEAAQSLTKMLAEAVSI